MGKTGVAGAEKAREVALETALREMEEGPEAPDVNIVLKEMAEGFRKLLQDMQGEEKP
jgi:hypothetical protein